MVRSEALAMRGKYGIMSNQQLAKELHEQITRKFEKSKVHSSFEDDIWGADLTDLKLISKYKKCFRL